MAVLDDAARAALWAQFMRDNRETCAVTKPDLRAAVNALDDFLNTKATEVNNALPAAARTGLTTQQKARLLAYVVIRRWGG